MRKQSDLYVLYKRCFGILMAYGLLCFISGFTPLVTTSVRTRFIDSVVNNSSKMSIAIGLISNLAVIFLYSYLIPFLLSFVGNKIQKSITEHIEDLINKKKSRIPYYYFDQIEVNDKINLINDASLQFWNLIKGFINIGVCTCEILLWFVVLSSLGIINMTILVGILCPIIWLSIQSAMKYNDTWSRTAKMRRHCNYIRDVLSEKEYAQERILFSYASFYEKIWKKEYMDIRIKSIREEIKGAKNVLICSFMFCIYIATLLIVLFTELKNGKITIGFIVTIITTIPFFLNNLVMRAANEINSVVKAKKIVETLQWFLGLTEDYSSEKKQIEHFEIIELKDVWFKYPNSERWILKNLNMVFKRGEQYSIVGENGAGKTTIAYLLLGLYKPSKGSILIDGNDITKIGENQIKNIISALLQNSQKYETLISENIGVGNINKICDEIEVTNAINKANIREFVEQLPQKNQTKIGTMFKGGIDLSGGEWQKIYFARLLMSQTPIKILDEPTASMDPEYEKWVSDNFSNLMEKTTSIVISHRLSFCKLVDMIYVLSDGQIQEGGTHQELLAHHELYYEMYTTQEAMYQDKGSVIEK